MPYDELVEWYNTLQYVKAGENCDRAIAASPTKGTVDEWSRKYSEGLRLETVGAKPTRAGLDSFFGALRNITAPLPEGQLFGPDGKPVTHG